MDQDLKDALGAFINRAFTANKRLGHVQGKAIDEAVRHNSSQILYLVTKDQWGLSSQFSGQRNTQPPEALVQKLLGPEDAEIAGLTGDIVKTISRLQENAARGNRPVRQAEESWASDFFNKLEQLYTKVPELNPVPEVLAKIKGEFERGKHPLTTLEKLSRELEDTYQSVMQMQVPLSQADASAILKFDKMGRLIDAVDRKGCEVQNDTHLIRGQDTGSTDPVLDEISREGQRMYDVATDRIDSALQFIHLVTGDIKEACNPVIEARRVELIQQHMKKAYDGMHDRTVAPRLSFELDETTLALMKAGIARPIYTGFGRAHSRSHVPHDCERAFPALRTENMAELDLRLLKAWEDNFGNNNADVRGRNIGPVLLESTRDQLHAKPYIFRQLVQSMDRDTADFAQTLREKDIAERAAEEARMRQSARILPAALGQHRPTQGD